MRVRVQGAVLLSIIKRCSINLNLATLPGIRWACFCRGRGQVAHSSEPLPRPSKLPTALVLPPWLARGGGGGGEEGEGEGEGRRGRSREEGKRGGRGREVEEGEMYWNERKCGV